MEIYPVEFSDQGVNSLRHKNKGTNWPVVYILHNKTDTAYIGETCNISNRLSQHIVDPKRKGMIKVVVITDDEFNKSVTLDVEQSLIRLCKADKRFNNIQNRNDGQSASHEYYNRNYYEMKLPGIWKQLIKNDLAIREYGDLIDDELYKYSPYTCLNEEQMIARNEILKDLNESIELGEERNIIVNGGAGTGKTILALNLLRTIAGLHRCEVDELLIDSEEDPSVLNSLRRVAKERDPKHGLKVAYCVPMGSLSKTLKKVVKGYGLGNNLIMGPGEIVRGSDHSRKKFDVVIIDESHRIRRRKNIQGYESFDKNSKDLELDPMECNQLDWIVKCSRYRIVFYDADQTVKGSDISREQFRATVGEAKELTLETQMRCRGGRAFTDYIDDILNCREPEKESFGGDFNFRIFDDVSEMVESIKDENRKDIENGSKGLCRVVAGYSWKWVTKGKQYQEIEGEGLYDIDIDGNRYYWNTDDDWILS